MKILIIESSDIGARYSAEAVLTLGYEPLFLCQLSNYQADTKKQILDYNYIDCDTKSTNSIINAICNHGVKDIVGVITFLDSRLSIAYEVSEKLGILGPDSAVLNLKDKSKVQSLIPEFSPFTISFNKNQIPDSAIIEGLNKYGSLIIKPAQTAGALGVFKIQTLKDLYEKLEQTQIPDFLNNDIWLAQEAVIGELFSVEGFVSLGQIKILGYSDRQKVGNTESRVQFPSNHKIPEASQRTIEIGIADLFKKSGFKNGYFHIEFILSKDEVKIIDANVGRLGGGALGELLALAYSQNPIEIYSHVIDVSLFGGIKTTHKLYETSPILSQGVMYGASEEVFFKELSLKQTRNVLHTQIIDSNTNVQKMGENNWSWIGIISGYPNQVELALQEMKILTSNGPCDLCY